MNMPSRSILLAGCINLLALSSGFAGSILTEKSINFTADDLATGKGTATKTWAIYDAASANNTDIWAQTGMFFQNKGLAMAYADTSETAYVTWKCTVPAGLSISSFTWAAKQLILNGATTGDDKFTLSYSTDGVKWIEFYQRENRKPGDPVIILNNQVYTVAVPEKGVTTLYIRAGLVEGATATGDSGYFAVVSNPVVGGGENAGSYITVTTTATTPAAEKAPQKTKGLGAPTVW